MIPKESSKEDVVLLVGAAQEPSSTMSCLDKIKWFLQGAVSLSIVGIFLILICQQRPHHFEGHRSKLGFDMPNPMIKNKLAESVCQSYLEINKPVSRFSVVLTADPGDFSGVSEAFFLLANLKNFHIKQKFNTVCSDVVYGTLLNQPVLVVTTGIGPTTAALCTQEILTACGPLINEAIYLGTSGWSPQLGGVLNPPNCSAANSNTRLTRVGDICVSPFSVNWQCKKSSWFQQSEGFPNQCFRPEETHGPNATYLYGMCQFYEDNMDANLRLASSFLQSARSESSKINMPPRPSGVLAQEQKFWSQMSKGTGIIYDLGGNGSSDNESVAPRIWDYKECMEVDEQFFFTGVPWEVKSRDYVAETLNAAFKDYENYRPRSSRDVVAVSAMEGVGVGQAFTKYNRLDATASFVPYTHVRSMANWVHHPLLRTSPGVWTTDPEFVEDYEDGYRYAIETGSSVVLSYFQMKCFDTQKMRPQDLVDCKFSIGAKDGLPMPPLRNVPRHH